MNPNELPPPAQLMKFIVSKWISKPIYVVAELGIADMLKNGPKFIEDLAQESNTHPPSLYRIMRALASVGIFNETKEKYFELTPMAEFLKTGMLRSAAILFHSVWSDQAWEYLLDGIKTGETPFNQAHGISLGAWLKKNPQAAQIFNEANAIKAATSHRVIIDAYDFSGVQKLLDVGGGVGTLMIEILKAYPELQGIIADLPPVAQEANKLIHSKGFGDRCQSVECDFFKAIPSGADALLLSNVLHDWPDDSCEKIMKNCFDALEPHSKILIVEMIIPPGNEPSIAKLLDMEMLVITGGRERTESEFKNLLLKTGFDFSRVIHTKEEISIIEGIRS